MNVREGLKYREFLNENMKLEKFDCWLIYKDIFLVFLIVSWLIKIFW